MSFSTDYASLLNAGPCAMELYNAHMAVPGAGPYGVTGHCRICDGLAYAPGTSAAYVTAPAAEAGLLGLFEVPAPPSSPTSTTASAFDQLAAKALRMPVQPLDKISAMAVRQLIPQYEAEAVVAYLYPKDGYNKNTPLALQVINRIARQNGMTRYDAEEMLRE
jgi:hypothetical protein